MLNEEQLKDLMLIMFALTFSTFGNILYCIKNKIKLNPIYVRILYGFMGIAFYIGSYLFITKTKPILDFVILCLVFGCGYFTQSLVDIIDTRLPTLFDRLSNKVLRDNFIREEQSNEEKNNKKIN